MSGMDLILGLLGLLTIGAALYAAITRKTAAAVLAAGAAGLFASVMYVALAAPDVAVTEAVIGSGLSTFIFFFALNKVKGGDDD